MMLHCKTVRRHNKETKQDKIKIKRLGRYFPEKSSSCDVLMFVKNNVVH